MAQPITAVVTHTQIHGFSVDVDARALTVTYSEGTTDEGGSYTEIRRLTKTIEGQAFAALVLRPVRIEEPAQSYLSTLYEVIKADLYALLP